MSLSGNHLVYEDEYNERDAVECAFNSDSNSVPMQELKCSGTLQYPVLTDVTISGVPVAWSHFSASNLRTLVLTEHPLENRLLMQTLHGILTNSKDTLETLTLKWAIALEVGRSGNHLLLDRVTLPRIKALDIGYTHTQKACQVLRIFDFPALRNLQLHSLDDLEWLRLQKI
ncbi:hypothetical protein EDD18DRAFT_1107712 [Armillaria luteobubalina]|uniref:Uncharacterized protein n=1 Tax=Armillaria luteobubalina TaxID=153913 RepID=A0AA39Q148_9AGAR|nr:hypothetical protein EDD18DRAFT_1107712 [Armillaria luteobubalina]